jgi:hypothetical protein
MFSTRRMCRLASKLALLHSVVLAACGAGATGGSVTATAVRNPPVHETLAVCRIAALKAVRRCSSP